MNKITISIVLFTVISFALSSFGVDYYVDVNNGSDITGDGTESAPWQTITFALEKAMGMNIYPDLIHIDAGTYKETTGEDFPLVMKSHINLIGAGRDKTILNIAGRGEHSVIHCENVEDVSIKGLTLTGGTGTIVGESG